MGIRIMLVISEFKLNTHGEQAKRINNERQLLIQYAEIHLKI